MASSTQRLDHLRGDIDTIDVALHELIVKRATIVEEIRKIKNGAGPVLRPGREAAILRRLAADHKGGFPLPALMSVWREMISAFSHMQEPFSAAVYAPAGHERVAGLARSQYGSQTPISHSATPSAAVRAVSEGAATIAILPMPAEGEEDAWWPMLIGSDKTPRVITRLPFLADGRGEEALVLGAFDRDLSADEATLVAVELTERASRSKIVSVLSTDPLKGAVPVASTDTKSGRNFHLIQVPGVVANGDKKLAVLGERLGPIFVQAHVVGGYALPLKAATV